MLNTIQKLHEKPEHVRRRYAFGVSFGVTALIALVWATSFGAGASGGVLTKENDAEELKPLAAVAESVREGVGEFQLFFDEER